jgi:membrane protein YdbS with pleckstrin-like domain
MYQGSPTEPETTVFEGRVPYVICLLENRFWSMFLGLGFILAFLDRYRYHIRLTTQRVVFTTGFLWRKQEQIELFRVRDIGYDQGLTGRLWNYGIVRLFSYDEKLPSAALPVFSPTQWSDWMREQVRRERYRMRVQYRELD